MGAVSICGQLGKSVAGKWRRASNAIKGEQSKSHNNSRGTPARVESLEMRLLLAVQPIISEFLASNNSGIADVDGDHSDWIEIYNPDVTSQSLDGYFLTDDAANLNKWRIPAVNVPGGGFALIFASAKDRTDPLAQLHTSFKLSASGGYLGLVAPDATTVVSSYNYPQQLSDISYGLAIDKQTTALLPSQTPVKTFVPTDGSLGSTWTAVNFNDTSWTSGKAGVGFDIQTAPPQIPGFTVKMVDFNEGIGDVGTASNILSGITTGYTIAFTGSKDYAVVNHGVGGDYGGDQLLPDGLTDTDTYALRATANVKIPAGTWSINVGSDDGASVKIPGVVFTNRVNNSPANPGADTIMYTSPRAHGETSGTFTVPAGGLSTTVTLDFYENGGGDDVELSIAPGQQTFNSSFVLLGDAVLPGWSVKTTSTTPPPDYTPLIGANVQTAMYNKNGSAYIRVPLAQVLNPADFDSLRLRMKYDDGFVAYLNGQEIARRNAPNSPLWNSVATASHPDIDAIVFEDIDIPLTAGLLQAGIGTNVLTIQGLNQAAGDNDFLIFPDLLGVHTIAAAQRYFKNPTPAAANDVSNFAEVVADTKFSNDRGFYSSPFNLTITTATAGAQIRYTTDGSAPTATNGTLYTGPIPISGTTVLRAMAYKAAAISTDVDTESYFFTSDIIHQAANGQAPAGWPASWSPNVTDYGMDPDVVNDPRYKNTIQDDLKSIPSYSIAMDFNDLFGPTGIYSNPGNDGKAWERPGSIELINPDGTPGFQIDGGIRIRGGFSRTTGNPKHAFRFFFRDEYGQGKLHYPVFGPDGASSFDGFDLRTFQNYSWSFQGDSRGIFMRDQYSRDVQLAMGQPTERGDYFFLYVNGQFWGLYNTDERPEASYGATYFGGTPDDYDTIKPAPDTGYSIYATDGNMDAWTDYWNQVVGLHSLSSAGQSTSAAYLRLQGLNLDGTRNPSYPVYLDVNNLIDYMLIIYYGGNLDAPLSNFLGNTSPNNFFALRNRNGDEGWKYFVHDAEHTLLNVNEDRTGPFYQQFGVPGLGKSNPQSIFELLEDNSEFRLAVADRIHKWFFNDGVLTPANAAKLFNVRVNEIARSVVGESARWGDAQRTTPFTLDDTWVPAVNDVLTNFFPQRTTVVFNQLKADNLYTTVLPPEYSQHGGVISNGFKLTINKPGGQGTIYYTTDGSDPRLFGGNVSPTALTYSAQISLNASTTVRARIRLADGTWSALTEANFYFDLSALRVTELMYNPAPPAAGPFTAQDFEFVELQNTGNTALNIAGASFTKGISFDFSNTVLQVGERILVVKNQAAFESRYGVGLPIAGVYTGSLDNNGEEVTLSGPGGVILDFTYNNTWYPITDAGGYSLVVINPKAPAADFSSSSNWRPSNTANGGPGVADPGINPGVVVINEVLPNTSNAAGDWIELQNTTSSPVDISGWFLSNDALNLTKYQIQPNTIIPANGFLVFTETQSFGNPAALGTGTAFNFGTLHEDVYLTNNSTPTAVGGYREHIDFGASAPEVTFGRYTKSTGGVDFVALSAPTEGAPNALPAVGPIVINEIMYNPAAGGAEFVELYNLTASAVPLYDPANPANPWKFSEGIDLSFPAGAQISAGGYALVVGIDPAIFRSTYSIPAGVPIFGPYIGTLDDNGENLKLARPGVLINAVLPYILVDQVKYDDKSPWPTTAAGGGPSLSRLVPSGYGNDPANWSAGPFGGTPGTLFTPPATPTSLTATATSASAIHLSWTDNAIAEDGFELERSIDNVVFTKIATLGPNITSYDDTGLTAATFYYYRIRTFNGAGNSGYSLHASAMTPQSQTLSLINITDTWKYNQSRTDLGSGWIAKGYNDTVAGWASGAALLYNETAALPAPKSTPLNLGPSGNDTPTFYFRIHFNLSVAPSSVASLKLNTVLDDGAAIYLNGNATPIFTLGMGAGPYTYATLANRSVTDAVYEGPFDLPISGLVAGDNVLAVEVHQTALTSSDVTWGCTLSAVTTTSANVVTATVSDVVPNPRSTPVDTMTLNFSEAISGLDIPDLTLSRNGGPNLLTAAQTVTTADGGTTWTLNNLSALTFAPGDYTLLLLAGGSNIHSAASHLLTTDASKSFKITGTFIQGTAAADTWYVRINGSNLEIFQSIPPTGSPTYVAALSDISSLTFDGAGGNDVLEIAGVLPFVPVFNGGAGSDKLVLDVGNRTFATDLAATSSIEQLDVNGSANVSLQASQHLDSLTLSGAARVKLETAGNRLIVAGQLIMDSTSTLDLADNDMIIQTTNATAFAATRQTVADRIAAARHANPQWSGPGLTTSTAIPGGNTGLMMLPNVKDNGQPVVGSFDGVAVDNLAVLVKYTYNGDFDLSGKIDADDYFVIDRGFALHRIAPNDGDLDFSGVIDADDYFIIDKSFLSQGSPLAFTQPANSTPAALPAKYGSISRASEAMQLVEDDSAIFSLSPKRTRRPDTVGLFSETPLLA
jgi:hypothetical protein